MRMIAKAMPVLAPPDRPPDVEFSDLGELVEDAAAAAGSIAVLVPDEVALRDIVCLLCTVVDDSCAVVRVCDGEVSAAALLAAVIVVLAAYVLIAPTVLTRVKAPPLNVLPDPLLSESTILHNAG